MNLVFIATLLALALSASAAGPKTVYFDQLIDHYNEAYYGKQTFKQKVMINEDYVDLDNMDSSTPIFFYSGNEGPIEGFYDASGFVMELAEQHNGLVVFGEHRYYGASLPFGEDSFQWPQIGLLSVDQATADYVVLLNHIRSQYNIIGAPIITCGGSYGGMLSAYLRFKFPDVFAGALAASAPVRLADSKAAQNSFWYESTQDYVAVSQATADKVRAGFSDMDDLFNQGSSGYKTLSSDFSLCTEIQDQADYEQLLYTIRNAFVEMTMFDYPYPVTFDSTLPAWPVNTSAAMINAASTPIQGLVESMNLVYNGTGSDLPCFNPYELYIQCSDPTGCGLGNDATAWDFQVCYELSLSYGSNGKTDMYPDLPWTLEMKKEYCEGKWNTSGHQTFFAQNFWGSNVWAGSNIIWSNGLLDPWHEGGILKSDVDSMPTVILELGAHHLDLRASNPADPPSVTAARETEAAYISQILDEYKKNQRKFQ